MLTIFVRSVILFVAAVLAMRMMGKRQVGQLQPYELVVVVLIAELAATPMGSVDLPLLYGLVPIMALIACHGLLTALSMRSERVRVWLCGQPTVLIRNGVICEKQLRKMAFTMNDLMEGIRTGGMLDPSEVGTAVLETGGQVTVFPKASARPVNPTDMNLTPDREGLPLPLILDGRIQGENLQRGGLTASWLDKQVKAMGYHEAAEILFMCLNTKGELLTQGKGRTDSQLVSVLNADETGW